MSYQQLNLRSRARVRGVSILLLATLAALLTGCASDTSALLEPPYGSIELARAAELMPLREQVQVVTVTEDGTPQPARDRMAVTGEDVWRRSVAGFWIVDLTREADGTVVILQEVETEEARQVVYEPPLPLIPAELRMGEPVEVERGVLLYNHENGILEATGTVTATYTLLGTRPSPDGDLTVIQTDRRFRMPLVIVDMKLLNAYAPDQGPVAGRTVRVVRLLGLLPVMHVQLIERR
jgi:hypothetical protein